jgi:UDP-3-O-[3-hydroxymyristoyl] glucosamine N-acyltransferase
MIVTLERIAKLVQGELVGKADIQVSGIANIEDAKEEHITIVTNKKAMGYILEKKHKPGAVIISKNVKKEDIDIPIIIVKDVRIALYKLLRFFYAKYEDKRFDKQVIHPNAIIADDVQLGKNIIIHPYVIINHGTVIEDEVIIYPFVYIGNNVHIKKRSIIYPNVCIYDHTIIGKEVIIHAGCVIGADGFGYVKIGEIHNKILQIGHVIIHDNVEIGANTTIDRATLGATVIGAGTKIDNLVQIGHNVKIGKNCIIVSQSAIGGSAVIEDGVIIAGKGAVSDHVTIGHHAVVGAKAGVMKDVAPKTVVSGFPARPYKKELRQKVYVEKLPEMFEKIQNITQEIKTIKQKLQ